MPITLSQARQNAINRRLNALNQNAPVQGVQQQSMPEEQSQTAREQNTGGVLGGVGYTFGKLGTGALRGLEGIWDFVAGGLADLFGADEWAQKQMENSPFDEWNAELDEWYNPSGVMSFVGDVAGGVGQMLPSVAVSLVPGAGPALSTGMFMTSAAGMGVADATRETGELGAKEWLYGTASGAVEGAIEKASGGIGGTRLGTAFGKQIAKSTGGKLAATFVGEGLEEVASDLIDPALRRVTGVDPDAKVDVSQLPNTFLVGGTAGAVLGGGSRLLNARRAGGFNNLNAAEDAASIRDARARGNTLQAEGRLTDKWADTLSKTEKEAATRLSARLQRMDADARARFVEQNNLGDLFDGRGVLLETSQGDGGAQDYNRDAISYSARDLVGRVDQNGNSVLEYQPTKAAVREDIAKAAADIAQLSGGQSRYVVTDSLGTISDGTKINAFYDPNSGIMYIANDADSAGARSYVVSHEYVHSLEGNGQYSRYANEVLADIAQDPELRKKYDYDKYYARYKEAHPNVEEETLNYIVQTEMIADFTAKELLTNEATVRRLVNRNAGLVRRVYEWVKDKIRALTSRGGSRENIAYLRRAEKLLAKALDNPGGGINVSDMDKYVREEKARRDTQGTDAEAETAEAGEARRLAETRMSIQNVDGKPIVVIDTDQNIFEGAERSEYGKIVRDYMREHFRGQTINGIRFNSRSGKEYTMSGDSQGLYRQHDGRYETKMRAGTELANLVQTGTFIRHEETKHPHSYNAGGYNRYAVEFILDEVPFSGEMLVALNGEDGAFYDIVNIKRNGSTIRDVPKSVERVSTEESSSNNSIRDNAKNVNRDGQNSEKNKRYSITIDGETVSGTVEETNDLVALHNLTEEKLLKVLDLGGFPMPSIAVTKPSLAHDNFGDITVVFGRETIDPQRDSRNKVFSRDAWTPTTPRVEYKLNEKRAEEINRKINSLIRGTDAELFGYLALDESNMTEFLNRNGGDLAQSYRDKDAFKYAYLRDKGIEVTLPTVDKEVSDYGNATIKWVADNLGKSTLNDLAQAKFSNEAVQPYVARVNELVSDYWQSEYNTSLNGEIDLYGAKGILQEAARYADRGFPKSLDERAAREIINEHLDESGYNKWIEELFSDVVEKAGLRNNRDMYTSAGRSRSFEALHDDYTLENVVRAMSKADPKGGSWLGLNPSSLAAKLSKEFKSISDMKKAAASLTAVADDAMSNFTTTAGQMLDEITADMVTREDYSSNFSYWNALDGAREVIGEIADRKLFTEKAIADYMKREYSGFYNYNADIGNKILGLFAYAKQMTQTGYFEAKPRRAVNFSEIKSVLLPETASDRLKSRLDSLHIPYSVYGSTATERSNAIQRLDGVRFALPETDSAGASLSQEQREFFKDSKVVDDSGRLRVTYHGSPNSFYTFDRSRIGKGNDQFGAGFYFATSEEAARHYGDNVYKTYLNITNPIVINRTIDGGDLFDVKITQKQAYEILKRHPLIYDPESSPLGDMFEEYWEVGAKDYMIREAAKNFNSIGLLDSDYIAYRDYPNELHEAIRDVLGYDGVEVRFDNSGDRFYVAWFENQIKLTTNKQPTNRSDIRFAISDVEPSSRIRYALPDEKTLKFLNEQETVTVYRAMQVIDGKLYPPMAARVKSSDGKKQLVRASEIGVWEQADERPELIRKGNKFTLDKANGSSIEAAYNPYFHTSRSPLNDQFSSAYKRDNLVIVEGEVPASELTSGYRAQHAKDAVGEMKWHSGPVSSKLPKGKERRVILSRWFKPVRIVPDSEVADVIADMLQGENISVPRNVVTPSLLNELHKRGVAIDSDNVRFAISDGRYAKQRAQYNAPKVYSRKDAERIVDSILADQLTFQENYGDLTRKNREQIVDTLWKNLNSLPSGKRASAALKMADYIIENAVLKSYYETLDASSVNEAAATIDVLRPYLHNLDLSSLRDEIRHHYDTDRSPYLLWAARKGEQGITPDVALRELEEQGYRRIKATNAADIFIALDEAYREAVQMQRTKVKQLLTDSMGEQEMKTLRQEIAKEILRGYDYTGKKSLFARLQEEMRNRLDDAGIKLWEQAQLFHIKESIFTKAEALKKKNYPLAFEGFDNVKKTLAKIKYRSDINQSSTRDIIKAFGQFYTESNQAIEGYYMPEVREAIDNFLAYDGEGKLDLYELRQVNTVLQAADYLLRNYDKAWIGERKISVTNAASEEINVVKENAPVYRYTPLGRKGRLGQALRSIVDMRTLMRWIDGGNSGTMTEMFEQLAHGSTVQTVTVMDLNEGFEKFLKEHKKFYKDLEKTVKFRFNGAEAEITRAEAISLYLTSLQEDGLYHLAFGGFAVGTETDLRRRYYGKKPYYGKREDVEVYESEALRETRQDMDALFAQFSAAEREYIRIARDLFNNKAKRIKQDIDMKRMGVTNARVENYFPMRVYERGSGRQKLAQGFLEELNLIANQSIHKDRVKGSKQTLMISPVNLVVMNHIRQIAMYNAYAIPLDTFRRVLNKNISVLPDGKTDTAHAVTLKTTIQESAWSDFAKFIEKFELDIQGANTQTDTINKAFRWLRSNYAKFQLGLNIKTMLSQLTSLPMAGSRVGWGNLIKGAISKPNIREMLEYCEWARARVYEGAAYKAQSLVDNLDTVGQLAMKPIGWVDMFTMNRIYNAAKYYIAKRDGLRLDSVECKTKAAEMLEVLGRETQNNSEIAERSAVMRSSNEIMKSIVMFSSDAVKQFSLIVQAFNKISFLKRKIKLGIGDASALQKQLSAARKEARGALASVATSMTFYVLMGMLVSYGLFAKEPEEDETLVEIFLKNMGGSVTGMIPIVRDLYTFFVEGYELDNFAYDTFNGLTEAVKGISDLIAEAGSGERVTDQEWMLALRKFVYATGQLTGLPTRNIYNQMYGVIKRFSPSAAYEIDSLFYGASTKDLNKAIEKGDEKLSSAITQQLLADRGIDASETVAEAFSALYAEGYSLPSGVRDSITYNGEEISLNARQQGIIIDSYEKAAQEAEGLINSAEWEHQSDAVKANALKLLFNYYYYAGVYEATGAYGDSRALMLGDAVDVAKIAIAYGQAVEMTADVDRKGNAISGTKKAKIQSLVNGLRLTAAQKYILMGYLGYKNANGENVVKGYIRSLGFTQEQQNELLEMSGYETK